MPAASAIAPIVIHWKGVNLPCFPSQQFLYFFPLPQGQGSLRPTFDVLATR